MHRAQPPRDSGNTATALTVPSGTQVVLRSDLQNASGDFSKGAIAELIGTPQDGMHSYRARFLDGRESNLYRGEFSILKQVKNGPIADSQRVLADHDLYQYVIFRCVVGSRAYGLSHDTSDIDRRGIYLPPSDLQWSLYGVPEQLEDRGHDECYWELAKFISLALKANPNILECLYTPIVEHTTDVSETLLAHKSIFLSKLVYQTYNGYVMSQFKKLEQDLKNNDQPKWKHAMHLIRLLLQGISVLTRKIVLVGVDRHRSELLAIRDAQLPWSEVNSWRLALHREFDEAFKKTELPEFPDYEEANRLLVWARRRMVEAHGNP